jgi:hypothetical protein
MTSANFVRLNVKVIFLHVPFTRSRFPSGVLTLTSSVSGGEIVDF